MPTEESKLESFDESVNTIAEKVRTDRKQEGVTEQQESGLEQRREAELEKIRNELRESYGDTGSSSSDNDDDDSNDEFDSAAALERADAGPEAVNYLETVPEKYREPVTELVQSAVQGGIVRATAKAQKKNDPYLVDVFHDQLAQLLHQRMQDQGLL